MQVTCLTFVRWSRNTLIPEIIVTNSCRRNAQFRQHLQGRHQHGGRAADIKFTGVNFWVICQVAIKYHLVNHPPRPLPLLIRFLAVIAMWWAMRALWPRQAKRLAWLALFFAIYPAYSSAGRVDFCQYDNIHDSNNKQNISIGICCKNHSSCR